MQTSTFVNIVHTLITLIATVMAFECVGSKVADGAALT